MRAAYYDRFQGPVTIESVPDPAPTADGVVIAVKASGLCLSDWHGWMGHDKDITLPHVPGHELAGEIVSVGQNVRNWQIGDCVTLPFVCGCGICPTCSEGNPQVCPSQFQPGFTHWGSFAEFVSIHFAEANLVRIPDQIDNVTAASLGCRFATSFRAVVDQGRIKQGDIVAVFGCGGVGLSAIMIAAALGARVIAIDTKPAALKMAREVGATDVLISQNNSSLSNQIIELSDGGVHVTIDAIGRQEVLHSALLSLRRRGRHVQIGLMTPDKVNATIPVDRVIGYELEVLGSHGMAASRYTDMLNMICNGSLKPELLLNQTMSLEKAIQILPKMPALVDSGINVITSF